MSFPRLAGSPLSLLAALKPDGRRSGSAADGSRSAGVGGEAAPPKAPPWTRTALNSLRRYPLSHTQLLVARAMLDYARRDHLEVWPGVNRLAEDTGLCERTVRKSIRALENTGAIQRVSLGRGGIGSDGRGITNRWRLTFAEAAEEPGTENARTRNLVPLNPARRAPKASIHESTKKPEPSMGCTSPSALMAGCPNRADLTVREALRQHGVRGPNLERLAASELTTQTVLRTVHELRSDPLVRSLPAVLVKRLAGEARLDLKRARPLAPDVADALEQIEKRRRSYRSSPLPADLSRSANILRFVATEDETIQASE